MKPVEHALHQLLLLLGHALVGRADVFVIAGHETLVRDIVAVQESGEL